MATGLVHVVAVPIVGRALLLATGQHLLHRHTVAGVEVVVEVVVHVVHDLPLQVLAEALALHRLEHLVDVAHDVVHAAGFTAQPHLQTLHVLRVHTVGSHADARVDLHAAVHPDVHDVGDVCRRDRDAAHHLDGAELRRHHRRHDDGVGHQSWEAAHDAPVVHVVAVEGAVQVVRRRRVLRSHERRHVLHDLVWRRRLGRIHWVRHWLHNRCTTAAVGTATSSRTRTRASTSTSTSASLVAVLVRRRLGGLERLVHVEGIVAALATTPTSSRAGLATGVAASGLLTLHGTLATRLCTGQLHLTPRHPPITRVGHRHEPWRVHLVLPGAHELRGLGERQRDDPPPRPPQPRHAFHDVHRLRRNQRTHALPRPKGRPRPDVQAHELLVLADAVDDALPRHLADERRHGVHLHERVLRVATGLHGRGRCLGCLGGLGRDVIQRTLRHLLPRLHERNAAALRPLPLLLLPANGVEPGGVERRLGVLVLHHRAQPHAGTNGRRVDRLLHVGRRLKLARDGRQRVQVADLVGVLRAPAQVLQRVPQPQHLGLRRVAAQPSRLHHLHDAAQPHARPQQPPHALVVVRQRVVEGAVQRVPGLAHGDELLALLVVAKGGVHLVEHLLDLLRPVLPAQGVAVPVLAHQLALLRVHDARRACAAAVEVARLALAAGPAVEAHLPRGFLLGQLHVVGLEQRLVLAAVAVVAAPFTIATTDVAGTIPDTAVVVLALALEPHRGGGGAVATAGWVRRHAVLLLAQLQARLADEVNRRRPGIRVVQVPPHGLGRARGGGTARP